MHLETSGIGSTSRNGETCCQCHWSASAVSHCLNVYRSIKYYLKISPLHLQGCQWSFKMFLQSSNTIWVAGMFSCLLKCPLARCLGECNSACIDMCMSSCIYPRFASIYSYDFQLFQQRFLGEPGVAWMHSLTTSHMLTFGNSLSLPRQSIDFGHI